MPDLKAPLSPATTHLMTVKRSSERQDLFATANPLSCYARLVPPSGIVERGEVRLIACTSRLAVPAVNWVQ